jgi:hypothetical protein
MAMQKPDFATRDTSLFSDLDFNDLGCFDDSPRPAPVSNQSEVNTQSLFAQYVQSPIAQQQTPTSVGSQQASLPCPPEQKSQQQYIAPPQAQYQSQFRPQYQQQTSQCSSTNTSTKTNVSSDWERSVSNDTQNESQKQQRFQAPQQQSNGSDFGLDSYTPAGFGVQRNQSGKSMW